MNTLLQDFHYTSKFLEERFGVDVYGLSGQGVLQDLLESIKLDGYDLRSEEVVESSHRILQSGGGDSNLIMNLVLAIFCVICAGLASGLTQGMLSLDVLEMSIKSQSGTPKEKEYASKLLPLIKPHHLLLVTLMLWNACATEALPIFLDAIVPEYVAIIISVTLVLLFGEIIPASILTGPNQLQITSSLSPLVYLVYFIFFPIAYPLSKLLDWIIGHEEGLTLYNKGEIATMMRMQVEEAGRRAKSGETLRDSVHHEEVKIIGGALKFRDMKVSDVMTPLEKSFMLSVHDVLSYKTIYEIFKEGYSRVPIYDKDKNDIIGLLLAKDLIFVDPEDEIPISNFVEFFGRRPMMVWHDQLLGETLSSFKHEKAHLAMVRDVFVDGDRDPVYVVVGIITLEDIIEEILGTEIEDEFDVEEGEIQYSKKNLHLRDMDLARFKALKSKVTDDTLSSDEVDAIMTYLPKQIPYLIQQLQSLNLSLKTLISVKSQVFVLKRQSAEGQLKPDRNDIIVRTGRVTNTCILILQGKIRVIYDRDDLSSSAKLLRKETVRVMNTMEDEETGRVSTTVTEAKDETIATYIDHEEILGPWSLICEEALTSEKNSYVPNFTACIFSSDLRIVRIPNYR